MKWFYVFLALVALTGLSLWFGLATKLFHIAEVKPPSKAPQPVEVIPTAKLNAADSALVSRVKTGVKVPAELAAVPVQIWETLPDTLRDDAMQAAPVIRRDVQNAQLVQLDSQARERLRRGDEFTMVIPQLGHEYAVLVEKATRSAAGNRHITARLKNNPSDKQFYTAVLTLGKNSLFGTIGTPEGIFNLNGNRQLGWLVSARELNYHVDPRVPDYVIPARNAS